MEILFKFRAISLKILVLLVTSWLMITGFSLNGNQVQVQAQSSTSFIRDPGQIPWFDDWETPALQPGEKGFLEFSIRNRYDERTLLSNNLTDVELTLGIYEFATLDDHKNVNNNFKNPPRIVKSIPVPGSPNEDLEGASEIITVEPDTGVKLFRFTWPSIPVNMTYYIKVQIETESGTPEGAYSIKTQLRFMHEGIENRTFVMRSLGYFSKAEWDYAKSTAPEDFTGNVNLTALNVDGIIPETSFSVKKHMPFWPFYICMTITVVLAIGAVVLYYMEEHGKFKSLKDWMDRKGL